ncbi:MAG: DUF4352 domain-containing protein [Anaerolineales bacterium]|nr:DUF4352 domain-containing protein [Anaerolineales bacterium]
MKPLHPHKLLTAPYVILFPLVLVNFACRAAADFLYPSTPTVRPSSDIIIPTAPSPTPTQSPTATKFTHVSSTPNPSPTQTGVTSRCENILAMRLLGLPEETKDLFEHHAKGIFLILHLEVINLTQTPVQIFSEDYTLILPQGNGEIQIKPHMAATNYLYLVRGASFYQDQIKPASIWSTYLAFDIPPNTTTWRLLVTPGTGASSPLCQTTLYP